MPAAAGASRWTGWSRPSTGMGLVREALRWKHGLEGDFNPATVPRLPGQRRRGSRGAGTIPAAAHPTRRRAVGHGRGRLPVGYMQDRQNARLMGVAVNGRRSSAHLPMPRIIHLSLGGPRTRQRSSGLEDGIYAVGFLAAARSISPTAVRVLLHRGLSREEWSGRRSDPRAPR